jgi:hypothetical protein
VKILNKESPLVNQGPSMNESHPGCQALATCLTLEDGKCYVCGQSGIHVVTAAHA